MSLGSRVCLGWVGLGLEGRLINFGLGLFFGLFRVGIGLWLVSGLIRHILVGEGLMLVDKTCPGVRVARSPASVCGAHVWPSAVACSSGSTGPTV